MSEVRMYHVTAYDRGVGMLVT